VQAKWKYFWEWLGSLPPSSASFVGSLTGAALGLAAIIVGALFNACLNRRRDDHLRKIEARTLAVALKAELAGLNQSLTENADGLEKGTTDFQVTDIATSVRIMPEMLFKLGLLDPETVQNVITAHGVLERYAEHCLRMGGIIIKAPGTRRQIGLPADKAARVAQMNRVLVEVMDKALVGLNNYLKS
jgi:hypothetical protein